MKYIIYDFSKYNNYYLCDNKNNLFSTKIKDALRFANRLNAEDNKKMLEYKIGGDYKILEVFE